MNDYVMKVDSNGLPYISHGFGDRAHKYIAKIGEGAKARYFYTQQEIDAYKRDRALNKSKKELENSRAAQNKQTEKLGSKEADRRKKAAAQREKEAKAAEKASKYNTVSVVDYVTGGVGRSQYKKRKKEVEDYERQAEKAKRAYDKAQSIVDKKKPGIEKTGIDVFGTYERNKTKAANEMHNYRDASSKAKIAKKQLDSAELYYEGTSLPGQTHRVIRKVKEKYGSKLVSELTEPKIKVRKSKR